MVAQVEDRLVDAARVAARAGARTAAPSVARPGAPSGRASGGGGGRTTNTSKRASTGSGTPGGGIAAPGRSVVSLKMLVAAGLMRPGPEALWITYLDQTWHGALDAAGAIAFQDQTFYSPSAWAIHCKRLANPGKKADDGWKSVRYGSAEGPTLHDVKLAFLAGVGRGTPGSAGRAREGDGAKAQQTLGFARQELPVASAGESPASDRKRRTGLVSGVSSPDAASELFSSKEEKSDEGQKAAPRATPAKRPREGEVEGELEHQSVKKPSAPSATDMSWLAAFADPADAEGAAERDARFAAAAPGATTRRCSVAPCRCFGHPRRRGTRGACCAWSLARAARACCTPLGMSSRASSWTRSRKRDTCSCCRRARRLFAFADGKRVPPRYGVFVEPKSGVKSGVKSGHSPVLRKVVDLIAHHAV